MFQKAAQWMTVMLIRIYQLLISPTIHTIAGPGSGCRFYPNCSTYAIDAIRDHGALRGLCLALRRILRCNCGVAKVLILFHRNQTGPMSSTTVSESDRHFIQRAIELAQVSEKRTVTTNPRGRSTSSSEVLATLSRKVFMPTTVGCTA